MKSNQTAFTVISLCLLANNVSAAGSYLGAEYIQTLQKYQLHFGTKVFKKSLPAYNLFGGFKFTQHFGVELGYEVQPYTSKTTTLLPGDSLPGGTNLISGDLNITQSKIRSTHPYFGFFGERKYNLNGFAKFKLQALLGLSLSRVKAQNAVLANQLGSLSGSFYNLSIKTYTKTRLVPMLKLSAVYIANDNIGIRLSANYRNMQNFKIDSRQISSPRGQLKLKDSLGLGLGLTYSF